VCIEERNMVEEPDDACVPDTLLSSILITVVDVEELHMTETGLITDTHDRGKNREGT